jgi:hypothetical protein
MESREGTLYQRRTGEPNALASDAQPLAFINRGLSDATEQAYSA